MALQGSGLWIHAVPDYGDLRLFMFITAFSRVRSKRSSVDEMAGGTTRLVNRPGYPSRWNLGLQALTRDEIGWLEEHAGQIVMVRDDRGNLLFGSYIEVSTDEHLYNTEGDMQLVFDEVTYSPAV